MVETVTSLPRFTTVNYTTKDGEHISATKNNGIVTLVGDKNGTRQMPIDEFMKELVANVPVLEKTPEKDTVEISKPATEAAATAQPKPEAQKSEVKVEAPKEEVQKAPEVGQKLNVAA